MTETREAYDSGDEFEEFVTPVKKSKRKEAGEPPVSVQSSAVPRSRYANSKAKKSLASRFTSSDAQLSTMARARDKLLRTKELVYPTGLTADMVQQRPTLEQFVCWTSKISDQCGVSKSTCGGDSESGVYFKVTEGKDIKFQAHKLMLLCKLQKPYTALDGKDRDSSHLCHNRLCWRPDHLEEESHVKNMSRNHCSGWLLDLSVQDQPRLLCLCQHEKPCLLLRVVTGGWISL